MRALPGQAHDLCDRLTNYAMLQPSLPGFTPYSPAYTLLLTPRVYYALGGA